MGRFQKVMLPTLICTKLRKRQKHRTKITSPHGVSNCSVQAVCQTVSNSRDGRLRQMPSSRVPSITRRDGWPGATVWTDGKMKRMGADRTTAGKTSRNRSNSIFLSLSSIPIESPGSKLEFPRSDNNRKLKFFSVGVGVPPEK